MTPQHECNRVGVVDVPTPSEVLGNYHQYLLRRAGFFKLKKSDDLQPGEKDRENVN
jgi:hypothetical protein